MMRFLQAKNENERLTLKLNACKEELRQYRSCFSQRGNWERRRRGIRKEDRSRNLNFSRRRGNRWTTTTTNLPSPLLRGSRKKRMRDSRPPDETPKKKKILINNKNPLLSLGEEAREKWVRTAEAGLRSIQNFGSLLLFHETSPLAFDLVKTSPKYCQMVKLIPAAKKLMGLIGLERAKQQIFDVCVYQILEPEDRMMLSNVIISGPPGVGKTRLAGILSELFQATGRVKKNTVVKAKRADLVGKYLGHTAKATREVAERARGGVLFIDEVYSLGHAEGGDSFSKECIDTLTQLLTEDPEGFVCIVAGYKDDVERCFFGQNAGLRRRFPVEIALDGYSGEELANIFERKMQEDRWDFKTPKDRKFTREFIISKRAAFPFFAGDIHGFLQHVKYVACGRLWAEEASRIAIFSVSSSSCSINKGQQQQPKIRNVSHTDLSRAFEKFTLGREGKSSPLPLSAQSMFI